MSDDMTEQERVVFAVAALTSHRFVVERLFKSDTFLAQLRPVSPEDVVALTGLPREVVDAAICNIKEAEYMHPTLVAEADEIIGRLENLEDALARTIGEVSDVSARALLVEASHALYAMKDAVSDVRRLAGMS